ncbi:hypothetical protein [Streptosporangium roseum]|uniref:hypothetical protein n=1 Tax=Streptosporangium roseum TaxID=2001 RepID=UPI0004CC92C4|nr:hypothetical protein [Streptosporangium roseum]
MITPKSPAGGRTELIEGVETLIRDRLAHLKWRMRREAAIDQITCRLAARMNVRPSEAAAHLARLSHESGVDLRRAVRPGPFEYVEIRDERPWPASVSVKAVRAGEGCSPPGGPTTRRNAW